MDDAAAAAVLFGSAPAPAAPVQPAADDDAAARLYGAPAKQPAATPMDDPAARLYGGPDTEPAESEPRTPRTEDEMEKALFGKSEVPEVKIDIPADILAERQADKDRAMFGAQEAFREVLPDTLWDSDPAAESLPEHVRVAVIGEMREMAADMGMSTDDVKTLRDLGPTFNAEPNDDQIIAWREESVDLLNKTYGNQATQALRDAVAFISQDPRRGKWLELGHRGDNPKVVAMFAKLGRKARLAGKLKAKG